LEALVNETQMSVKDYIAQFIAIILRQEFPNDGWPELKQFIHQSTTSDNMSDKQVRNMPS
jgi:hypothetical protein